MFPLLSGRKVVIASAYGCCFCCASAYPAATAAAAPASMIFMSGRQVNGTIAVRKCYSVFPESLLHHPEYLPPDDKLLAGDGFTLHLHDHGRVV